MWIKLICNPEIKLLVKRKVDVTKVVDLVSRIPKQLSLHFYDFCTILYGIYNFAVLRVFLQIRPRSFVSSHRRSLVGFQHRGGMEGAVSGKVRPWKRGES